MLQKQHNIKEDSGIKEVNSAYKGTRKQADL